MCGHPSHLALGRPSGRGYLQRSCLERAEAFQRLAQLNKKLDHAMMASLLRRDELRADGVEAAVSASQNGLSELEFVVSMLLQLDIADAARAALHQKFRALDADGSGRLGKDDLELAVRYSEDELLRMRQRNSQVHKQGALVRGQSSLCGRPPSRWRTCPIEVERP